MKKSFAIVAVTSILLAGCDTYTSDQYQSTPQNTITLQTIAATGKRASVASVTVATGVEPRPACRLAGPIDIGGGNDIAAVIKQALQAEFLAGNIFSPNGVPLSLVVTELEPDSFSGTWTIGLRVSSPKGAYDVKHVSKFSTSFSAYSACNNTADAFNRALSETILSIIQHPSFRSIL